MPRASNPSTGLTDTACGHCGMNFRPARASSAYCSVLCARKKNGGHNAKPETWWINAKGYIEGRVLIDGVRKRVKQHRYFVETALGRPLAPDEDVHHRDGDKQNNDLANLEVIKHGAHSTLTNTSRDYRRGWKQKLSPEERQRRSDWMKSVRRAALSRAGASS